jgi:hypothetical protein
MKRTIIAAFESQNECRLATTSGVLHLKLDFGGVFADIPSKDYELTN